MIILLSSLSLLPAHNVHPPLHPLLELSKGAMGLQEPPAADQYHVVFSTGCSPSQHWQALMFFYHAWKAKQPGTVTRIASGCDTDQQEEQQRIFNEQIAILSDQFRIHFTPDFTRPDKTKTYNHESVKYFNKPFGLRHWMTHVLGYPDNANQYDDDIIMILDPDMMLMKPLTHHFDPKMHRFVTEPVDNITTVRHGHPFAQLYGFGSSWRNCMKGNISHVVGTNDSPVLDMTDSDANDYYPAGPPYIATARDMYRIATTWCDFLPRMHDVFPQFMAEMHAYSTAAAHLRLPHLLARTFMVSDVGAAFNEGWDFLDEVPRANACRSGVELTQPNAPAVFHYCQRYAVGRWFVGKYKLREDFFTCAAPLLRDPPQDVSVKYNWWIYPNNVESVNYTEKTFRQQEIVQNGWAMCKLIESLNEAATHYKKHHCHGGADGEANYAKEEIFHPQDRFDDFLENGGYHG